MRRFGVLTALVLSVVLAIPAGAGAKSFPDVVPLPDGFRPEGVVVGAGHDVYTGSLANGAIWKGDLRTGEGEVLVPGAEGGIAVGMDFDERSGYLFVAGGTSGVANVYDGDTGDLVSQLVLGSGFINDVIVTRTAAYFTNSFAPEIYRVGLERNGRLADEPVETIPLGGDFPNVLGFNANGIEATQDASTLFVVSSAGRALYTVDPSTGVAGRIDLDQELPNGDGLLLVGRTMYVVQNQLNQIAEISLSSDLSSGAIVDTLTSPEFEVPTTATLFGNGIYAVNAQFGSPSTEFEIVRVDR